MRAKTYSVTNLLGRNIRLTDSIGRRIRIRPKQTVSIKMPLPRIPKVLHWARLRRLKVSPKI